MEFEEAWRIIEGVEGWTSHDENQFLFHAAKDALPDGVVVEIGSFKGRSTVALALGSLSGPHIPVVAIDQFAPFLLKHGAFYSKRYFHEFQKNIERSGVSSVVVVNRCKSAEFPSQHLPPIKVLFIDGCHDYEAVKADYDKYVPLVAKGGVIALHDTDMYDGPKRLVEERLKDVEHVQIDNMTVFKKTW